MKKIAGAFSVTLWLLIAFGMTACDYPSGESEEESHESGTHQGGFSSSVLPSGFGFDFQYTGPTPEQIDAIAEEAWTEYWAESDLPP